MKLTSAQQKLVEDNHNLIYSFLNSQHLPHIDYYDIAAIGLCKAAIHYDQSRSKQTAFSTYAYRVMYNEIKQQWCREQKSVKASCSLNEPISGAEGETALEAILADPRDYTLDAINLESIVTILKGYDNRYPTILYMTYQGHTQKEIGLRFGLKQTSISRLIKKMKEVIRNSL